jgi:carbon monoxide dehydrogenase subunit G
MIRLEGDRQLPYAPAEAWTKLRDPGFLVRCIQGGQPTGTPTEDEALCIVRPNYPFMRGSMELTVRIADATPPTNLQILILGKGTNVGSTVEVFLTLSEHNGITKVHWSADVKKLEGMLSYVQAGQIQTAAQKIVQDAWNMMATVLPKELSRAAGH